MPRKSDAATRRSDVSTAKFVLNDSEPIDPESRSQTREATTAPPAAEATPAVDGEAERASESAAPGEKKDKDTVAIEDLNLPKSIITRLAKGVLPPNTQIQANAILAMTKAATVFINHLANAANEKTLNANKKTIMPPDVFDALDDIEFAQFRETVQKEFKRFNEVQSSKRNTYRRKVAAAKKGVPFVDEAGNSSGADQPSGDANDEASVTPARDSGADAARSAKKQRLSSAANSSAMAVDDDADMSQEFEDAQVDDDDDDDDDEEEEEEQEEEQRDEDDEDDEESSDEDDESVGDDDDDEMHDALEEPEQDGEDDEALDNGDDSDS